MAVLLAMALAGSLASCGSSSSTDGTDVGAPPDAPPRSAGSEVSIERFGSEASGAERKDVLDAERGYLKAIADRDAVTACSYLSASVKVSLRQFAQAGSMGSGCAAVLLGALSARAPSVARQQVEGAVRHVRVEGDQAFVVFHAPGARLYVFTMQREDGDWKAPALIGSILVPSPASVGGG